MTGQIVADVIAAVAGAAPASYSPNGVAHLRKLTETLREAGHDPVVLCGGMGAQSRDAVIARLAPRPYGLSKR